MTNSADPEQLASSDSYTVRKSRIYLSSAGLGLKLRSHFLRSIVCVVVLLKIPLVLFINDALYVSNVERRVFL